MFRYAIGFTVLVLFMVPTGTTQAGFFSSMLRMFGGESEGVLTEDRLSSSAAISLPLLGTRSGGVGKLGMGGPVAESDIALSVTQDSALVAPRNPLGLLDERTSDEIFVYAVQPGDTPGGIAERFDISLNTLLWANNIRNQNIIKIGDELVILPVSGVKYEVKSGDTIDSIAKKFKGDREEIMSFNGIGAGEALEIGMILIIPDGEIALPLTLGPVRDSRRFSSLPDARSYFMRPIFGGRKSRGLHGFNGIDLADACGLPIIAAAEGTVILARPSGWNGGYGNYLVMTHPNGTQTLYAHVSKILASVGQRVAQGSQVAMIGSTGNSTGCHIHFEVRGARNPF